MSEPTARPATGHRPSRGAGLVRVLPVAAALLFTAYSLHRAEVALPDTGVFASYLALGLVLPGVVMWRLLVSRGTWTLLGDLACGTSLAYAVELGVYLVCAHAGHPDLAWIWPVVPLVVSLHPRLRPLVWRAAAGPAAPAWMPWLLGGLTCYGVAVITRTNWNLFPLEGNLAHSPYVDTPYHLALVGALSRHVPVDLPSVAGEPLYYHWFVHAELAASRHATGIEPLVLLTRLGPLPMMVVGILGVAALAQRLTGSYLTGGVAATLYAGVGSANLTKDFGTMAADSHVILSPTTVFATALLIATAAVTFELLRPAGEAAHRLPLWLVLAVLLGAISGAKGSLLPVLLGGYAAVLVMAAVFSRRLHRAALGMLLIALAWFLLAQQVIYGGSAQGTEVKPFGLGDMIAVRFGLAGEGHVSFLLAAGVTLVYVGSKAVQVAGVAGLFTREAWRDERAHFAVGCCTAAVGAVLAFNNAAYNQVYFLLVAPPLIAVASAWGFTTLARRLPTADARRVVLTAALAGLVVGWVAKEVFADKTHPDGYSRTEFFLPVVLALLACAVAAAAIGGATRAAHRRIAITLAATVSIATLGAAPSAARVLRYLSTPGDQFRTSAADRYDTIGRDGIEAARWLRDHSEATDVVATNAHCTVPGSLATCDRRKTWIAAFTERQMLLEGWAYSSRSATEAEKQGVPVARVPFWHPEILRANDEAFRRPTAERIEVLHDRYDVRWMFADLRFGADVRALDEIAREVYRKGDYAIYQLG